MTERCQFFLYQGLAPSTRRVYLSAQRRYVDFCRQDGHLSPDGALLPADEQSLMRFASFLADSLHHSSIKVYLSAVRSLHIDNGLPDPLINCLQLQRLLRGIKRVQGSSTSKRLPITSHRRQTPFVLAVTFMWVGASASSAHWWPLVIFWHGVAHLQDPCFAMRMAVL